MIRRITNKFRTEIVIDRYFGEMGVAIDSDNKTYYLDKDIELMGIHTPVVLYLESFTPRSVTGHQVLFERIMTNFPDIWRNVTEFLTQEKLDIQKGILTDYRIESITIPLEGQNEKWELNLLNLKDGFSYITIELEEFHPFHFSSKA